jgi:uncharacterized damage-inducible protein DinB
MRTSVPTLASIGAAFAITVLAATPARAQTAGVVTDLMTDVAQVEQKMVALAKAMPADKYAWRPGAGVRSFGEVMLHIASDNYLMPGFMGVAPDPATGIKIDDFKTLGAFEHRNLGPDATVAELSKSFANLKKAMTATTQPQLADKVNMFGMSFSKQAAWVLTTTHLHEHLGQAIAYARTNGVVPPWSKKE